MLKYILCWFPMMILAILNGAAREWYKRFMSELTARQISTIALIILLVAYITIIVKSFPPKSSNEAIFIGCLWLVLTLIFEFGFGLYRGNKWSEMLAEYNLLKGRFWILVPICIAITPYIIYSGY